MAVPLSCLDQFTEEARFAPSFFLPALVLVIGGLFLWRGFRRHHAKLSIPDACLAGMIGMGSVVLLSTVPLMAVGDLPFWGALCESTSGWTATGVSVVDTEQVPHVLLLWRSVMQLAGGAAITILLAAVLMWSTGVGSPPGGDRVEEGVARLVRLAAGQVTWLYLVYTGLGIYLLKVTGMDWFDAINHAFTAVSAGGFTTKPSLVGTYDAPAIQFALAVTMFLGRTCFLVAFYRVHRRERSRLGSESGA